MRKIIVALFLLLIGAVVWLFIAYNQERKESNRLGSNQHALLGEVTRYKTNDSLNAASTEMLRLHSSEIEEQRDDLRNEVESLNIKLKRVKSISNSAIVSSYPVEVRVTDTFYLSRTDTIRCINYQGKWVTLRGCIENRQFNGNISTIDTIVQVVHRVPKQFWFIRYGTKAIRQDVKSKNPHSSIAYTEYIQLE